MSVAQTILQQLGGGRFVAMTGARGFLGGASELQFSLPRFSGVKVNRVRIILTPADTYRVEFYRVKSRGLTVDTIATCDDVYADQLRAVFTTYTGLATSLGTMGRAR